MTIYALPDGTQAELVLDDKLMPFAQRWIDHPSLGLICVADTKLTEVPPSLPEELCAATLQAGDG